MCLGIFVALLLFFTDWFVSGLWGFHNFKYQPLGGPLYGVFVGFFLWCNAHGFLIAFRRYQKTTGLERKKNALFIIATGIGYGLSAELFLQGLKIPIDPHGVFFMFIYVVILGYAIFRYRFLDIEVLIKKTLVFTGIVIASVAVLALPFALIQTLIGKALGVPNPFILMAFGIATTALIYDPVRKILVNLTDKYLFQKKFNLTSIVAQAGEAIALVQSLRWLSRRIVAFLVTKCRIKSAVVYIRSRDNEHFERGALRGFRREEYPVEKLRADHLVIRFLQEQRRIIEKTQIEETLQKKDLLTAERQQFEMVRDFLKNSRAEVIIPSFLRRRIDAAGMGKEKEESQAGEEVSLRNVLVLGGKKSDEPYLDEELEVFYGLAQESAIAIENARLYDEAVQRTRELVVMNKELNDANAKLKVTQASLIVAEKNATMVGMAKAIGHEINNPLATVGGRATWIFRDDLKTCRKILADQNILLPEEAARGLEKNFSKIEDNAQRIAKSARRIEVVVKTLTDILKDTKGEKGPLSLLVLCREAREATRFLTYEENLSGCEIVEEIATNIIILGNLEQLLQVFVNLIKNAYEAMIRKSDRRIVIRGEVDPDYPKKARIEFIDNGPGIPEEILPKIWLQGYSTKMIKEEHIGAAGQGQGLFICKHVVESIHNGEIFVESTSDKGTKFVIRLPLADLEG